MVSTDSSVSGLTHDDSTAEITTTQAAVTPGVVLFDKDAIPMLRPGFGTQFFQPAQSRDPMESCAVKAVTGGAMGGLMGAAMGLVLGGYGSIAPPVVMPGVPDPPSVPMRHQLRESWLGTARRMRGWGRNFGAVTIVFSGVECVIEKYRAQHDIVNGTAAGCITGGALAATQGPVAACIGCIGFATFSAAIETLMGGH